MRLYKAVFCLSFQNLFIRRHDSLSRQELDARNLSKRSSFLEVVADKYNNPLWVPQSQVFAKFQYALSCSYALELEVVEED
eukprot:4448350-Ditylum_brightwellii.AAC.1